MDYIPLNWQIIGNPVNWLIIFVVLAMLAFAFHILVPQAQNTPQQ